MARMLGRAIAALGALGAAAWLLAPEGSKLATITTDPQQAVNVLGADAVALAICQLLVVALCCWAALAVMLCALSARHPDGRAARVSLALTPSQLRRPLALALGVGTLALAACGQARPPSSPPSTSPAYVASSEAFDWPRSEEGTGATTSPPPSAPDVPTTTDPSAPDVPATTDPSAPPPASSAGTPYEVLPGDSLWSIARAHLGPGATAAQIAYLVDEIYASSATVIGADPDLLHAGTTLSIPTQPS